jgi:tetratricopeptide (TPR) repeat protein
MGLSRMLTDNEVRKIPEDTLQFKSYADTLVEIISYSQTPITIGVYGEWGSGKTSLMRLTENELEEKKEVNVKSVWFNAWKYDKAHDLRVALINSILQSIKNDKTALETVKDKAKGLLKRVNWLGLGRTAVNIGASIATPYLAIIPLLTKILSDSKKGTQDFGKLLPDELLKEPAEGKTLELIGEFEEEFMKLSSEYVGKDGRLVVFIDDLDRCIPEKAIDILEAIKLFLNVPQTVFLIGTDKKVIENGILQKYGDKSVNWGKNYLDKIIQVPFTLPPLSKKEIIEHFITQLDISSDIKGFASIVAEVGDNPRTIKRLLNNFELQRILTKNRGIMMEDMILAKFNVLEFRWPEFYSELINLYSESNKFNLLKFIEDLLASDESERENLLKERSQVRIYLSDKNLIDFLNKEPMLYDVDLELYIHMANANYEMSAQTPNFFELGFTSYGNKDYIKAIEYFTKVIDKDTKNVEAFYNRGLSCMWIGNYKRAINDYTKVIDLSPEHSKAYYWRAFSYNSMQKTDDAIKDYSKSIEFEPDFTNAYNDRGLSYIDKKDYDKAIADFNRAIKLKPDYAEAYFNRGIANFDKKEYDNSVADNTKAIGLFPEYLNAFINRGLSYHKMKSYRNAFEDYLKALIISPVSELAGRNLKILVEELNQNKDLIPADWQTESLEKSVTDSEIEETNKLYLLSFLKSLHK